MKILLTFDYELFSGSDTGTVHKSIIEPTSLLLDIFTRHACKATFFVDAGYVYHLEKASRTDESAEKDYLELSSQLHTIAEDGHDIQLHVHPHWEDAAYENGRWNISTDRFRLHDFDPEERIQICRKYVEALKPFARNKINAFRAGGWFLQPFDEIAEALKSAGITTDSTVFRGGYNHIGSLFYDYRDAPAKTCYRFEDDPLVENPEGGFVEIPITETRVSPTFYWKYLLHRFSSDVRHKPYGDGETLRISRGDILKRLTSYTHSVVSCDGTKSSLLQTSLDAHERKFGTFGDFVVIGHPKAATPYSLEQLERFLALNRNHEIITVSEHPAVK